MCFLVSFFSLAGELALFIQSVINLSSISNFEGSVKSAHVKHSPVHKKNICPSCISCAVAFVGFLLMVRNENCTEVVRYILVRVNFKFDRPLLKSTENHNENSREFWERLSSRALLYIVKETWAQH